MHGIHNIATQIYAKFAFTPTFGQKKIIEKLSEWVESGDSERIFILNGYAGTGKTTLLGALVEVLRDNAIRPVLLAPTGRAAKVLAQYTGEKTYTIHKKIYRQQTSAAIESKFSLDYNRERGAIFIIDEASMLANGSSYEDSLFGSGALLEDLVKYVRSGRDCRLMLVGDSAQLPPVGNDYSPALDPVYMSAFGSVDYGSLDDVVRQDIDSGILFNATLVRTMLENRIFDIPLLDMSYPDVESIDGGEFMEKIEECYSKWGRDETIVITRSNKRANRFNEALRRRVLYAEEEIESGDMLMVVKNNYYYACEDENDKETGGMNFIANGDIARLRRLRRFEELYGFRFANAVLEFDDA
ncbi:MAG: AAA family ATPase, partial [Rikenellaceae bacterium]|nr:AAA family ATPase [Rikenellaceae bacterium]